MAKRKNPERCSGDTLGMEQKERRNRDIQTLLMARSCDDAEVRRVLFRLFAGELSPLQRWILPGFFVRNTEASVILEEFVRQSSFRARAILLCKESDAIFSPWFSHLPQIRTLLQRVVQKRDSNSPVPSGPTLPLGDLASSVQDVNDTEAALNDDEGELDAPEELLVRMEQRERIRWIAAFSSEQPSTESEPGLEPPPPASTASTEAELAIEDFLRAEQRTREQDEKTREVTVTPQEALVLFCDLMAMIDAYQSDQHFDAARLAEGMFMLNHYRGYRVILHARCADAGIESSKYHKDQERQIVLDASQYELYKQKEIKYMEEWELRKKASKQEPKGKVPDDDDEEEVPEAGIAPEVLLSCKEIRIEQVIQAAQFLEGIVPVAKAARPHRERYYAALRAIVQEECIHTHDRWREIAELFPKAISVVLWEAREELRERNGDSSLLHDVPRNFERQCRLLTIVIGSILEQKEVREELEFHQSVEFSSFEKLRKMLHDQESSVIRRIASFHVPTYEVNRTGHRLELKEAIRIFQALNFPVPEGWAAMLRKKRRMQHEEVSVDEE